MALGAAVIVTGWSNLLSVREASTTLYSGQNDLLLGAVAQQLRGQETGPAPEALRRVLAEQSDAGLRYLAVYGPTGELLAHAGMPAGPVPQRLAALSGPPGPRLERLPGSGRIRTLMMAPPHRPRSGRRRGDRPAPLAFLIEFEPLDAAALRAGRARCSRLASSPRCASWRWPGSSGACRGASGAVPAPPRARQRRLASLGEMSAVLAHEIRNPLASLKGHAQLLAEQLAPTTRPSARKAERVVHEAVAAREADERPARLRRAPAPLERVAVDPGRAAARRPPRRSTPGGIALDTARRARRWSLDCGAACSQVLANLLRNAVQASPPGAPRRGRGRRARTAASSIAVRDHGPGCRPGEEERIFEPFFTTRASGTGLGLAVARRIVELHGGTLTRRRTTPRAARVFRVALPQAQES